MQARLADIFDRAGAHQRWIADHRLGFPTQILPVVLGKLLQLFAPDGALGCANRVDFQTSKAVLDVRVESSFALLAVGNDVDAVFSLFMDHVHYGCVRQPNELVRVVWLASHPGAHELEQPVGSRQAADMRSQNAVCTPLHALRQGCSSRR